MKIPQQIKDEVEKKRWKPDLDEAKLFFYLAILFLIWTGITGWFLK